MNVRWFYSHRIQVALLVTAAVAVGLMTVLVARQQQDQANGQVYLEAGGSVGSNPFVPLIPPPATAGGELGGRDASIQTPAGTDNRPACDTEKLISYLTQDPQAGAAWVHALNSDRSLSWSGGGKIEALQIPAYIRELTPRVLTEDLRVTNYQFTNGTALAVQSVLEKGTGILVDPMGVARVRCSSGNPLAPMVQQKTPPIYRGKPWPSFQPQRVVIAQGRRPDMQRWSDQPARPEEPRRPDQPARPEEPRHPDQPARSEEPRHPDQPARPEEPRYPDQPADPKEPRHPDQPARPDKPGRPGETKRPDKVDLSDQPKNPDKSVQQDKQDKDEWRGKAKRAEKPVRPDKPVKPDKPAKPERDVPSDPEGSPE